MKRCANCAHFSHSSTVKSDDGLFVVLGECRRYPPRFEEHLENMELLDDGSIEKMDGQRGYFFPVMPGGEWCGEFKNKYEDMA